MELEALESIFFEDVEYLMEYIDKKIMENVSREDLAKSYNVD